nr:hypothetical protein CFP56_19521 [Quercus suber]
MSGATKAAVWQKQAADVRRCGAGFGEVPAGHHRLPVTTLPQRVANGTTACTVISSSCRNLPLEQSRYHINPGRDPCDGHLP